jgi:hypothetical protein
VEVLKAAYAAAVGRRPVGPHASRPEWLRKEIAAANGVPPAAEEALEEPVGETAGRGSDARAGTVAHDEREAASPAGADLAAELVRRGLVRRDNDNSSRHTGVYWDKNAEKWRAKVHHGGKQEHLGSFATEAEAKACYDARCLELGRDPDAGTSSAFRGVSWDKKKSKWTAQIKVDGKKKFLGVFEATARGEVDAALAYDVAARFEGWPEKANFELGRGASGGAARPSLEEAQGEQALPTAGGSGSSPGAARAPHVGGAGQALPGVDLGALAAEIARRGLVRRDNEFSSRHKGVSWKQKEKRWRAEVSHGGKQEHLGSFATEEDAKARRDARCLDIGRDPDAGTSSAFLGVGWV